MATTPLVLVSNRLGDEVVLDATSAAVPMDAAISELYSMPAGVGEVLVEAWTVFTGAITGLAVPTGGNGFMVDVLSSDGTSVQDIGQARASIAEAATAVAASSDDLAAGMLVRQAELVRVRSAALTASAGATAGVRLLMRGRRLRSS